MMRTPLHLRPVVAGLDRRRGPCVQRRRDVGEIAITHLRVSDGTRDAVGRIGVLLLSEAEAQRLAAELDALLADLP
jgi:hypothetical protein